MLYCFCTQKNLFRTAYPPYLLQILLFWTVPWIRSKVILLYHFYTLKYPQAGNPMPYKSHPKLEKRIAFALPFFNIEIFAIVMPTFSESSVTLIFRFANITSRFTIMAIISPQTVKSFSVFISTASCNSLCKRAAKTAIRNDAKTTTIPITMIPGASSNLATKYKKGKITI